MSPGPGPRDVEGEISGRWGTTIFLSLVLHLAGFGLAVALPRLLPRGAQGPPVYVVDLVSLPASGAPTGGAAPPAHAPVAAPSKKKAITPPPKPEKTLKLPERGAKLNATKKKPIAEPKPTATLAAPADATPVDGDAARDAAGTAAKGGAKGTAAGVGTGGGAGSGTGSGDETQFYFSVLYRRIENAWQKPIYPPNEASRRVLSATVRLTVSSSGRVIRLELVTPSGYDALDRSVQSAVQGAQPFPFFPDSLTVDSLTVQYAFDLTPE